MKHILSVIANPFTYIQVLILLFILTLTTMASIETPPANTVKITVADKYGTFSGGSGTLIRSDLIITNWHVTQDRKTKDSIQVSFPDGSVYKATLVKESRLWDLAALRINAVLIPPVEFGENPKLGEIVVVGGYGGEGDAYRSDEGRILFFYSPSRTTPNDLFQVDAKVRNGDSGGPILKDGKLVGVLFGCLPDGTYGIKIERVCQFLKDVE